MLLGHLNRDHEGALKAWSLNLILGETQVAILVLLNPSRGHLGSRIFGGSTRSEVKRAEVWGF